LKRIEDMTIEELRAALLREKMRKAHGPTGPLSAPIDPRPRKAEERAEWYRRKELKAPIEQVSAPLTNGEKLGFAKCLHQNKVRDPGVKPEIVEHQVVFGMVCQDCGVKIKMFRLVRRRQ